MAYKLLSVLILALFVLSACAGGPAASPTAAEQSRPVVEQPQSAADQAKSGTEGVNTSVQTIKPAAAPSGTLVAAISSLAEDNPDPAIATLGDSNPLVPQVFEWAITPDAKGNTIGALAESWTVSPDGKTWTIKVRKGIKFHNGDDVTSADFKFSMERYLQPDSKNPWTPFYRRTIDSIETPDPYTMVIQAKAVDAPFAYTGFGFFILPKNYIEKNGWAYFDEHPVGTGPWKFVNHVPGVSWEYEAVPNHWRVTPAFQRLIIKVIPDEATRIAMLKRGEVDVAEISLDNIDDIKAAGLETRELQVPNQVSFTIPGTWLNTDAPTMDIRVRQALSLAVNRDEMSKTFFKGYAQPAVIRSMTPNTWGYDSSWTADPYDPARARQLLADAGYPGKFKDPTVTVYSRQVMGAGWLDKWSEMMAGYFAAVGVKTKLVPIDNAALTALTNAKPPDPKVVGALVPGTLNNGPNMVYHIANVYASNGSAPLLHDPEMDALYEKVYGTLDDTQRMQVFRQAMVKGRDTYVSILGVDTKLVYAVSNKVGAWSGYAVALGRAYEGMQHK